MAQIHGESCSEPTRGNSAPPHHPWQQLAIFQKTFLVITLGGEGAAWIKRVEARDAAKHPTMNRGFIGFKVSSAELEKLRETTDLQKIHWTTY